MKATEIKSERFCKGNMLATYNDGQHYKFIMSIGRMWPTTMRQARRFLKTNMPLGVLGGEDVQKIEELCARHGLNNQIEYNFTGRKLWVRIELGSYDILEKALRLEYHIGNAKKCTCTPTYVVE